MKRVYLTGELPSTTLIDKREAPDIRRCLETYRTEKGEYANRPPEVRPLPMAKYGVSKGEAER